MLVFKQLFTLLKAHCYIGFYNAADTLESSSILIYSHKKQSVYSQGDRHDAVQIEKVITIKSGVS